MTTPQNTVNSSSCIRDEYLSWTPSQATGIYHHPPPPMLLTLDDDEQAEAVNRVPTDTGKPGKPGKMRQLFPVREKSGNFEKTLKSQGKVREF